MTPQMNNINNLYYSSVLLLNYIRLRVLLFVVRICEDLWIDPGLYG